MGDRVLVNVEVAVVREDGRFLMIIRGSGEDHAAGALCFPGGTLDFDERQDVLEAVAIREVHEEVGITIRELRYVESKSFVTSKYQVVDVVFLALFAGGTPTISDHDEVAEIRWMTSSEIQSDPATPPWTMASISRIVAIQESGSCASP